MHGLLLNYSRLKQPPQVSITHHLKTITQRVAVWSRRNDDITTSTTANGESDTKLQKNQCTAVL